MVEIVPATEDEQFAAAVRLFQEYAATLGFDLEFQGFSDELADLRAMYGPPAGCLLLAVDGNRTVGCVGVRYFADGVSEMKRMYVVPDCRGLQLGRRLADAIISRARELGYRYMRLDTIEGMAAAEHLYVRLGFRPIPAYRYNPIENARYYELDLSAD
jgi:GNAT superfamily N-acetyltransferase